MSDNIKFENLLGQTLVEIDVSSDSILFIAENGQSYSLYHEQNCCEEVSIEDVVGDFKDLLGEPLLVAEEVSNADSHPDIDGTWTFYKLATIKGYVDIRWLGTSNGYYSEAVDFAESKTYSMKEVQGFIIKNKIKRNFTPSFK